MLVAVIVLLIICLVDLNDHNKKVDKMFADPDPNLPDARHWRMRHELHVSLYGFYLLLILLIALLIKSLINEFL